MAEWLSLPVAILLKGVRKAGWFPVSYSCVVKISCDYPVYGDVLCSFDEDLQGGYYIKHTNLIVPSISTKYYFSFSVFMRLLAAFGDQLARL